jgi:hypothetical protein
MNAKYIIYRLSIKPKRKLITPKYIYMELRQKKMAEQIWCVVDDSGVPG